MVGGTASGARTPGAVIFALAMAVAALWMLGSAAAVVALLGTDHLLRLTVPQMGAVGGAVFLPALMAVFSGLAVRDGANARHEAKRLADAADRLLNPERSAEEAGRKLAMTVRGEINQLDRALEQTLARLQEVDVQIAKQAQTVDAMGMQAKAGANEMISGMERERGELMKISRDLTAQAQTIGDSISRHTQSIAQAARQAEAEVRAADVALDHRLTSFGAAAALINDRTHGLSNAAQASADSALKLETALSNALDILAKATHLTDAARQSADAASVAANSTAGAVRDTTHRAIDDAKRAADLIRNEAASVEREAAIALERLQDAAEAARAAAVSAREAAEENPIAAQLSPRPRVRERNIDPEPHYDRSWRDEPDPLDVAPPSRMRRTVEREGSMFGESAEEPPPADWTWRDLLSNVDQGASQQRIQRPRVEPAETAAHLRRPMVQANAAPASAIVELIEHAGLQFDDIFSPSALERIAQRSRSGSQSRRRAVREAAAESARRLGDYLARDPSANQEALEFLRSEGARISELLGRGRAAMGSEVTRAFLILDTAVG
jgi:archaellum component FlaC